MANVLSYSESFQIIHRAKETNSAIMNTVIKKLDHFHGNINKLLDALSKVELELPIKRDRKPMFDKKGVFKKDKDFLKIKDLEPNFSIILKSLNEILTNPSGLMDFNEKIMDVFIAKFKNIKEVYENKMNAMEKYSILAKKDLETAENNYKQAYLAYNQFAKTVDELKAKIDMDISMGKTPDQVLKSQQNLNDMKNEFRKLQEAAVTMLDKYNEQKILYTRSLESALTVFEEADFKREQSIQELFDNFAAHIIKYATEKKNEAERFNIILNKFSLEKDFQNVFKQSEEIKSSQVTFEAQKLPFEICEYVSPETLFADEIKKYTATVIEDFGDPKFDSVVFSKDEIVTVIEERGEEYCYVCKENLEKGLIQKDKLKRNEKYDHNLYRVIEDFNSPTGVSAVSGEILMSLCQYENEILCQNPYFKKLKIPSSKLLLIK